MPRVVDDLGEGELEPFDVRAAVDGVDVVGVGIDDLVVALVVLKGDLAHRGAVALLKVERLGKERLRAAVELFDELADAALVAEGIRAGLFAAQVGQRDGEPAVQESELFEPHAQMLVLEDRRLENFRVGQEGDLGARLFRLADDGERALRHAAVVDLAVDVAVLIDFRFQPFGKGVDRLDADAVQTARNFVARVSAELTARVDLREDDFHRRNALFGVDLGGDAAAVVFDGARTVHIDGDFDVRAVARERFVDGVIDDLAHEMMQPPLVRGADIHTGALADVLQTVEHLDLFRAVCALYLFGHRNLRRADRPFFARVRARVQIMLLSDYTTPHEKSTVFAPRFRAKLFEDAKKGA